jgi:hypothetical protein
MRQRFRLNRRPGPRVVTSVIPLLVGLLPERAESRGPVPIRRMRRHRRTFRPGIPCGCREDRWVTWPRPLN